ncbi:hypothetical protein EVAR_11286_1 [Eumeta japonica]|uniref:Uncharacterized protein n=1 Tax=Eumeta variegata TaxID=151549 RepID=A0A4C1ULK0_EUMVA|nr:hypothetical protein EVAR_11286_1 [Eumeta japonica]
MTCCRAHRTARRTHDEKQTRRRRSVDIVLTVSVQDASIRLATVKRRKHAQDVRFMWTIGCKQKQKRNRVMNCHRCVLLRCGDSNIVHDVVTGDKSWLYSYDPESERQSAQGVSPFEELLITVKRSQTVTADCGDEGPDKHTDVIACDEAGTATTTYSCFFANDTSVTTSPLLCCI